MCEEGVVDDRKHKIDSAITEPGGLSDEQSAELAENRVASLFHLSNPDHPVIGMLQRLCVKRLLKKLRMCR